MELLEPIPEFPGYWVSNRGYVKNERRDTPLTNHINNGGLVYVNINRGPRSYNRGLAKLVAEAFLPSPDLSAFDTPINLNGDRQDCRAENLMWRPNWFARRYHQQFHYGREDFYNPVYLAETNTHFPSVWDAAIKYGLLVRDIMHRSYNHEPVWPGNLRFQLVSRIPT